MNDTALSASYSWCERLARRHADNFYPAFRILPRDQRRAMCAIYAFMRLADDFADDPGPIDVKRAALADWRRQFHDALTGRFAHPVLPALGDTVTRFRIPPQYLDDVCDGVEADLESVAMATFDDLYRYCYRVASAVGLACIHIWGFSDETAKKPAEHAGIALQLTNILRDLGEDRANGRVYLPAEDLRRFGCAPDQFGRVNDNAYRELMAFQIQRARGYYDSASSLSTYLTCSGRAVFQVILATYRRILDEIERRGYDVLSSRVSVSRWTKVGLVLRALPVRWGLIS